MNIIITLTETTWLDMFYGKRTVLLRSQYPHKFDVTKDHIFVCVKTTGEVHGYFDVTLAGKIKDHNLWYNRYWREVGMPWLDYKAYCELHRSTYAFFIERAVQITPSLPLSNFRVSTHAPQAFYYTDFEI